MLKPTIDIMRQANVESVSAHEIDVLYARLTELNKIPIEDWDRGKRLEGQSILRELQRLEGDLY